ncbi:MAG: amidohydrolase family protein [Pyramidobacter sp.]|jgi:predicted TIM-barrel fold metal-dependent hydrolase
MIVDVHAHVYPEELRRDQELISRKEPHFDLLTHNRVHRWGTADDLVARMDETGIDQTWIFGFAFRDQGLCRLCNDYVIDAVRRYPARLKGFASISPMAPGMTAEAERCADAGLIGIGELFPQGQNFALDDLRQTWRLAAVLEERGLILSVHTAEPVGHDYDGKGNVGPKEAAGFCINHPAVKVVFAHFGGGLWLYETMPEMKMYLKNACYDTAAWPFLYGPSVLAAAKAAGVLNKMLYGTDWPILDRKRFETRLENCGLTDEEKAAFLGKNAENLMNSAALTAQRNI